MTNNQYTYNQPPMGQMMPPPTPPRGPWQRRAMNAMVSAKSVFPKWFNRNSFIAYLLELVGCYFCVFSLWNLIDSISDWRMKMEMGYPKYKIEYCWNKSK